MVGWRAVLLGVPELLDALAGGRRSGAQLGELLADLPLVAADLPGELERAQPLAAAGLPGPVVAFHLGRHLLGVGGAAGDRGLLVAAGGEVRLQPRKLPRRGAAMADWLADRVQALRAFVLDAQPRQPLAGHRRRGADLGRQLGGIKPLVAVQLPPQVGVGDPVAHQPRPQLSEARVVLVVSAQYPHQVAGQVRRYAHLAGQGGRVDRLAGVDLALKPGVGDPLPRWPRVTRPFLLLDRGRDGGVGRGGHRRPLSRCGHTTRAAVAWPCSRNLRRCIRVKARSVLRPRRRCARATRRAARCSARSRRASSRGV